MNIRKIKKSDLKTCANILKDAYSQSPYNENFKKNTAELYIQEKFEIGQKNSFVIEDTGKVLGFIFLRISSWSNGPQAILEEIVIKPSVQNSGLGDKLMEYAQNYLKKIGVKSIMLWAKDNERLLNFYEKHGYLKTNDFVVMSKEL